MGHSVYKTDTGFNKLYQWYEKKLSQLPINIESLNIETSAGTTHVLAAGDPAASPLIVLHGMNMNAAAMDSILVEFAMCHRVFAVDIIGMPGKSAGTRFSRKGNDYPNWLMEVLKQLNIAKADFLGLSFGGWLILKLASVCPGKINSAILLDSGGITPFTFSGQITSALRALFYMVYPSFENFEKAVKLFYSKSAVPDPQFAELMGISFIHTRPDIRVLGLPTISKSELIGFKAPAMVMYGEHDIFFNAKNTIKKAKEIIPNLLLAEIVPNEGHILSDNAYMEVISKMKEFYSKIQTGIEA
jgi:pimeloyl-ACP methyl ester carboxylesterase